MVRRVALAAIPVALALATLTACDDEPQWDVPSALLQPEDLPAVQDVTVRDRSSAPQPNCAAMEGEYSLATTNTDDVTASYTLENDDEVRSAVQGPAIAKTSIDPTMDQMDALIDECLRTGAAFGTFERLELADGQVGYQMTEDTSDGTRTTERGYAKVDDDTAAVVTVIHVGSGEPSVSVDALLPAAVDRAASIK